MEAVISLQHIFRVARAVNVDPLTGLQGAVAYIIDEKDALVVAEVWRNAFEEIPELVIVVVEELPRGARVEWHIIRCQKTSDDGGKSTLRIAYEDGEVTNDLRGEFGVLCMVFGSQDSIQRIKSRYTNIAIQAISSRAVYSVKNGLQQHSSCTIIFSE